MPFGVQEFYAECLPYTSACPEEEPAQDPRDVLRLEATSVSSLPNGDDVCIETVLD